MIDIHSHILPGVDDGAATLDDSVVLVRELVDGGVTDIIATPHYVDETNYVSSVAVNSRLLDELRERLSQENLDVRIFLGNEIYISNRISKLLAESLIKPLAGSKYLLVELPMSGEFPSYYDVFLKLIREGYQVILAHPERYATFQKDFGLVLEMHDMGVLLQCNIGSFVGQYGKAARKTAEKLAKNEMIFALGSDIHHPRGSKFMPAALKRLSRFYEDFELEDILVKNPRKIIGA